MAGSNSAFDPAAFRTAIQNAMQMGSPPDSTVSAVFVFPETGEVIYKKNGSEIMPPPLDLDGIPFDPLVERIIAPPKRVAVGTGPNDVHCAIEMMKADADEIPVGSFRPVKAVVTFLDEDYAKVVGCREMILNGDTYVYGYEPGAMGLFEVGVNQMIFYAKQET